MTQPAKQLWASPVDHASDATFRTWAQEFHDKITTTDFLVNTSDTGQLTIGSATKPGAGGFAGYKIYRFQDVLQATSPIYMKVEFGSGATSSNYPNLRVTLGTATDGAGNFVGNVVGPYASTDNTSNSPGTGNYNSYMTAGEGYFGLVFKASLFNGGFSPVTWLFIERTYDSSAEYTADGFCLWYTHSPGSASSSARGHRVASLVKGVKYTAGDHLGATFSGGPSAGVAADGEMMLHRLHAPLPYMKPLRVAAGYYGPAMSEGSEFDATIIGDDERHYIACGNGSGPFAVDFNSGAGWSASLGIGFVLLWED